MSDEFEDHFGTDDDQPAPAPAKVAPATKVAIKAAPAAAMAVKAAQEEAGEDREVADAAFVDDVMAHALRDPEYAKRAVGLLEPSLMPTTAHTWIAEFIRSTYERHGEMPDTKMLAHAATSLKSVEESSNVKMLWLKLEGHAPRAPKAALAHVETFMHSQAVMTQWEQVGVLLQRGKVDEAERLMMQAVKRIDSMSDVEVSRWMEEFEKRQEQRIFERDNPDSTPHVKTGWAGLDKHMNGGAGVRIGQCGGILAVTNMGKSVVAVNFGFVAATAGHKVIHISTEMSAREVDTRYDSRFTGLAADKFPHYKFTPEEEKRIGSLLKSKRERYMKAMRIVAMPVGGTTKGKVADIVSRMRDEMEGLELFIFDSPDHMQSGRPAYGKEGHRLEQASNYWWLKSFCQEMKCAGWCTVQAGSQAAGGVATNEDISESYDKARILDFIFSLNAASKTDRSTPKHEVTDDEWDAGEEIQVGNTGLRGFLDKNRHGPAKIDIPLYAELDKMLIIDGDLDWHEQKPDRKKGKR